MTFFMKSIFQKSILKKSPQMTFFQNCCHLLTFVKIDFFKKKIRNSIRVSNSLDQAKDRHTVGPDLGPNCLQMLSADNKSQIARKELKWEVS